MTVLVAASTNYVDFNRYPAYAKEDLAGENGQFIKSAGNMGFDSLLQRHMDDYRELFSRVDISIGDKPDFYTLLYQYGRYLTIAASRQGSLPSNLQGMWNAELVPKWGCNYTTDINLEMNYWLTETTGIPECHQPLLDFIETLSISGEKTAKYNYGIDRGWMVHSNSDAWGQTVPQGGFDKDFEVRSAKWTCWPMAGLWLAQHLWDHYDFNRDEQYLRLYAYPIMKGAAEFAMNWMYRDPHTGFYVTSPSTSPENRFLYTDSEGKRQYGELSKAATMDMSLIWDNFTNCIEASEILGIDRDFRDSLMQRRAALLPFSIGRHGQLMEWSEDFDEAEVNHRHLSHLFGLYPGRQIVPRRDPVLARSVKTVLERRGDDGPGWDMAWKICLWSRLEDGDRALSILDKCLVYVDPETQGSRSGIYPNMFMAYPPFQFDANAGVVAGMTEMLVQSHADEIFILPALPRKWSSGHVSGLKARGNFEISMDWDEGKLTSLEIKSLAGGDCIIRSRQPLSCTGAELEEIVDDHWPDGPAGYLVDGSIEPEPLGYGRTFLYRLHTDSNQHYKFTPIKEKQL